MQEASDEFAEAVEQGSIIWIPTTEVDWADNGYGGAGTIDDLSPLASGVGVVQSMDDGLPDEVSLLSNSGIPSAAARLGGGFTASGEPLTATQYWSPFFPDSPLFGLDRDVQPARVKQGLIGSAGPESVTLFTGKIDDTPLKGGKAGMQASSQTRLDLSLPVQPGQAFRYDVGAPTGAIDRIYGLTATWPIVWALHECGVLPSPPAQDGIAYWFPLHGGGSMYLPEGQAQDTSSPNHWFYGFRRTAAGTPASDLDPAFYVPIEPRWIRGPYVGAAYCHIQDDEILGITAQLNPVLYGPGGGNDDGASDYWSQASPRGRVEFWIRGDDFDTAEAPGGTADFDWENNLGQEYVAGFTAINNVTGEYVIGGINESRALFIQVSDGAAVTVATGSTLPTDGEWHFIGLAWDVDSGGSGTMWMTLDNATATAGFSITLANLPLVQNFSFDFVRVVFCLPVAELHFTVGTNANPDTGNPWRRDENWTQRAFVYPSSLGLEAVAEPRPLEAWQLISQYAQNELAAIKIDELDQFHYMPQGHFATVAGSAVQQTMTADYHTDTPDVILDSSRIRTVVRIAYQQTKFDEQEDFGYVLEYRTAIAFPPFIEVNLVFALDTQAIRIDRGPIDHLEADHLSGALEVFGNYVSLNTESDGSGTLSTNNDVDVVIGNEIEDANAGQVIVTFTNLTDQTWYLIHSGLATLSYLGVTGVPVISRQAFVTEFNDDAIATRGLRLLTVQMNRIQSEAEAVRVARRLLGIIRRPQVVVEGMQAFGDPRRQPGDKVTLSDADQTGLSTDIRIHSIRHDLDEAKYTQTIQGRQAPPVGVWGQTLWGQCVWAGLEEAD